ncbi:MAG: hypothetical protein KatS3mg110_3710 [Pirellulaceae bacterium]|nr:MAG: hypothetical protein KatS3mg110_3710 [Pirellulaceae bacterium]
MTGTRVAGHPGVLWIVGASGRAAAQSARRAGFQPCVADAFGDWDTCQGATTLRLSPYPAQLRFLAELADVRGSPPLLYVGGLENYPKLLKKLEKDFTIVGTPVGALPKVRNPWNVARAAAEAGFEPLELIADHSPPESGVFVWKRYRSAGGLHVFLHIPSRSRRFHPPKPGRGYYQAYAAGVGYGAVYLGANGRAVLVGVTRQLTGIRAWGARRFLYSGSLTVERCGVARPQLERLGNVLAEQFGLVGLFGVDFIVRGSKAYVVEVNPRYTASCELLERQLDRSLVADHWNAWYEAKLPPEPDLRPASPWCFGKAVVYALQPIAVTERLLRRLVRAATGDRPAVADIPRAGTEVLAGAPLVTVLARGRSRFAVRLRLSLLARSVQRIAAESYGL